MTTADQLAIVNKLLQPPEKVRTLAQAVLVQDWVKSKRLLVVVLCGADHALFVFTSQNYPVTTQADLVIDDVIKLDDNFKFDIDSGGQNQGPDVIYITVSSSRQNVLFEMLPGYHTQNFVSEMYRLTENSLQQDSEFSWLAKYPSSDTGGEVGPDSMDGVPRGEVGPDSTDGVPRGEVASSMATLIVATKEEQFTDLKDFTGTWNVNGQSLDGRVSDWLVEEEEPPDIYAVGFRQLIYYIIINPRIHLRCSSSLSRSRRTSGCARSTSRCTPVPTTCL